MTLLTTSINLRYRLTYIDKNHMLVAASVIRKKWLHKLASQGN